MYMLSEAFQALSALNEEEIVISDNESIEDLEDIENEVPETVEVIDVEADTEEELEDSYIGKTIMSCNVCNSLIYRNPDEELTEEDECPYCASTEGFSIVGKVVPYEEPAVEIDDEISDYEEDEEDEDIEDMEESCGKKSKNESVKSLDIDITDFDERSFNELAEQYFANFENVKRFRVKNVAENAKGLVVEGVVTFKNNNRHNTKFILEAKDATKYGKVRFNAYNKHLSESKKAFVITGKVNRGKLFTESIHYNHKVKMTNESLKGTCKHSK